VTFGCEVDTLTLSKEQKALAEARAKAAGVSDRVRVHLLDYRRLPKEWKGQFDAFVAIEMLEHVVRFGVLLNRTSSFLLSVPFFGADADRG
jgi:cyclopropane fatty-acyl-phospholipid synthase-like methyltransferase